MTSRADSPVARRARRYDTVLLAALALGAAWFVTLRFPVWFRSDDATYLAWAATHTPADAFRPGAGRIVGMFRPAQSLVWLALQRSAGLAAFPYQLTITTLYGLSFVLFYRAVSLVDSRRTALAALAVYALLFHRLFYVTFWFSDLTFVLEIFFLHLGLALLVPALRGSRLALAGCATAFVLAGLSKEPAVVLGPVLAAAVARVEWPRLDRRQRRTAVMLVAGLGLGGIVWLAGAAGLGGRLGAAGDEAAGAFEFAARRLGFYGRQLAAGLGPAIWLAAAGLAWRAKDRPPDQARAWRVAAVLAAVAGALATRVLPAAALPLLFAALAVVAFVERRAAVAALWIALPLAGLTAVSYMVRTYLVEASFGAAWLVAAAAVGGAQALRRRVRAPGSRRVLVAAALAVALVAGGSLAGRARAKLDVLRAVVSTRAHFAAVFERLCALPERGASVVVIEYEDMGEVYVRDVLPLPDALKVRRQKTMNGSNLQTLLEVAGRGDLQVRDLAWLEAGVLTAGSRVVVMNRREREFLRGRVPALLPEFASEDSREGAWIYRVVPPDYGQAFPGRRSAPDVAKP